MPKRDLETTFREKYLNFKNYIPKRDLQTNFRKKKNKIPIINKVPSLLQLKA